MFGERYGDMVELVDTAERFEDESAQQLKN